MTAIVPLYHLADEPFASVICYPEAETVEMQSRIGELKSMGVEAVEFSGRFSAGEMSVLGKGRGGIVAAARAGSGRLALKMQRVDSDRESMEYEAEMLSIANMVGVGPRLAAATKHFLMMQLVDGHYLEEKLGACMDKTAARTILTDLLEQCWRLDGAGLDHGELIRGAKHILVDADGVPFIIDFDTASICRNASNVTSLCHFLFLGESRARTAIESIFGEHNSELIDALRIYRKNRDRQSFEGLLEQCFFCH